MTIVQDPKFELELLIKQDKERRVHVCTEKLKEFQAFLNENGCDLSVVETRINGEISKIDLFIRAVR